MVINQEADSNSIPQKKFSRRKEDFICLNCGHQVTGNGYTDHCPKCLYSRHVDVNPGDRAASCRGLMEPVGIEIKNSEYVIRYVCQKCDFHHRVKATKEDDTEEILKLSTN